ncbi:hypothetical protein GHT06_008140 [Daphnia sinensis]|uniref:Uncharacterized protein n=1 Tax=Daphnia sinensis TaxID=1820382 RepID=A0AAD5LKG6_9CRUS|nr:hypothetical protein GHT06_008140 [Daphnia sinensis]
MRLILSFVIFFAACAAKAKAENYRYNTVDARLLFKPKISLTTQTTTTTSTFTVSCTKSTTLACAARAARALVPAPDSARAFVFRGQSSKNENEEQFPADPTPVQGVEATPVPNREARAADPQYIMSPLSYYAQEIQSGINNNPFNYHSISLREDSYPQPAAGQQRIFGVSLNGNQAGSFFGSPNFFPALPGVVYTFTSTFTITSFTVTTSTSTPLCSAAGFLQCPP